MHFQNRRSWWIATVVWLALAMTGLSAHGLRPSTACHPFDGTIAQVVQAHKTLVATEGSATSADRMARYHALRTLAEEHQRITLLEHDEVWADTSGLGERLATVAALHEREGNIDDALRQYRRYQRAGQRGPRDWPETTAYQERRCWTSNRINQLIAAANAPTSPSPPGH